MHRRLVIQAILLFLLLPAWADEAVPVWPVYQLKDAETALLEPTGPDLPWSTVLEIGNVRQIMSNNPECLGLADDYSTTERIEATRYPQPNQEGKLWFDEAEGAPELNYHVFFWHINVFARPLALGLVVENLSRENRLVVSGEATAHQGHLAGSGDWKDWAVMKDVGKACAYSDLSDTAFTPLTETLVPRATDTPREYPVAAWMVPSYNTFGAHVRVKIRPRYGDPGPVHVRLSTAWAWAPETLATGLPLLARKFTPPRGSWRTSEVLVANTADPFDLGVDDAGGRTVRQLRLCQPRYENGVKIGYNNDVPYTKDASFNSEQALMNNGMYAVRTNVRLHVKNSGNAERTLGIYLRYPDKKLRGSYVGAATIFRRGDTLDTWAAAETRAVDLGAMDYRNAKGEVIKREDWTVTKQLASYTLKAGETLVIPLTIMSDGPSMLPLGIVLRKEMERKAYEEYGVR